MADKLIESYRSSNGDSYDIWEREGEHLSEVKYRWTAFYGAQTAESFSDSVESAKKEARYEIDRMRDEARQEGDSALIEAQLQKIKFLEQQIRELNTDVDSATMRAEHFQKAFEGVAEMIRILSDSIANEDYTIGALMLVNNYISVNRVFNDPTEIPF